MEKLPVYKKGDTLYLKDGSAVMVMDVHNGGDLLSLRPAKVTTDLGSGCGCTHDVWVFDLPTVELHIRPYIEGNNSKALDLKK